MNKLDLLDLESEETSESLSNQWIIFQCGNQKFGLKAESSHEIARLKDIVKVPGQGEFCRGMVNMRGRVFSVMDLSRILGYKSRETECNEMNDLLVQREQDHVRWLNELHASVLEDRPFGLTTDPHACAFGKWYDVFKSDDFYLNQSLRSFDLPHKAIHAVGKEVIKLVADHHQAEAIVLITSTWDNELALMRKLFSETRDYLKDIFRETIVIFNVENEFVGMVVDEVLEVREFQPDQIKPVTGNEFADNRLMLGSAIIGESVVLLLDIFKIATISERYQT